MRMQLRNLCVLNYGQGFTTWLYRGDVLDIEPMLADGFLDDAADMFNQNDVIYITSLQGTAMRTINLTRRDGDKNLRHVTLQKGL